MGLIPKLLFFFCFLAREEHFEERQKHDGKLFCWIFHNLLTRSTLAAFFFNIIFIFHSLKEVFIENLGFFFFGSKKINENISVQAFVKELRKGPCVQKRKSLNVSFGSDTELLNVSFRAVNPHRIQNCTQWFVKIQVLL